MPKLLVKPEGDRGTVTRITPESAGWTYVGFEVIELSAGETAGAATGDREVCLVLIAGKAAVASEGQDFGVIGQRTSPFAGKPGRSTCRPAPTGR